MKRARPTKQRKQTKQKTQRKTAPARPPRKKQAAAIPPALPGPNGQDAEARKRANLTPGGQAHKRKRMHYKVDRLPPAIQQMIAEEYAAGTSFRDITERVRAAGHPIGKDAIRRYWHAVWREEHEWLQRGRLALVVIKRALQLDPDSESAKVAEEILYTLLCGKLKEMEGQPWQVLLHEAREQQKTGGKQPRTKKRGERESPAAQAREVRRRWRELYGLDEADEEASGKEKADEPV